MVQKVIGADWEQEDDVTLLALQRATISLAEERNV